MCMYRGGEGSCESEDRRVHGDKGLRERIRTG